MDEFQGLYFLHTQIALAVIALTIEKGHLHTRLKTAFSKYLVNVQTDALKAFDPDGYEMYQGACDTFNQGGTGKKRRQSLTDEEVNEVAARIIEVDARLKYFLGEKS